MINLKEKIEGLNSVLDFMDLDLSGLSEQQKLYWAATFYYLYEGKDVQIALEKAKPSEYVISVPRVSRVDLSVIQDFLRAYVEKILKLQGSGGVLPLPKFERRLFAGKNAGKDTFQIQTYQAPKLSGANAPDFEILENTIAVLIEDLPRPCIKRCAECGHLFIHVSKQVKLYCSQKCSFKHLSRKRREELKKHPRKYNAFKKAQREKMKKIYAKKQKAKYGPNVVIRRNGKRTNKKED